MPPFQDPEIYRDILDGLQIGVSVIDLNKKIVFWSDGAEHITGYARIDVLGHSCSENILLHCNQESCEMCIGKCPVATALHSIKPAETIGFIHHRFGHWIPVHSWAVPLRDDNGSILGIIQTFESEFAVNGPDPNDQSMKKRGCMDHATDLPNQAIMHSHVREMLGTFAELQMPFGVIFLEVHALSQFHARYGQAAATSMLRVLARTLRNSTWPTDFVGRWSQDQFLVILSGCDEESLPAVCERILRMTARATIEWWGEKLSVTVLIGSTSVLAGDTAESLLLRAQEGLKGNRTTECGRAVAAGNNTTSPS